MTSQTENLVIDGKSQLVIKFHGSTIQNSPNIVLTGKITISNSSSIKIIDGQIDARGLVNEHAITINSGNNYFKNLTVLGDSGYGVLINSSGSAYN